ncbi:butyrophilin-like protein 8 [Castor canadensis]|uniref:Butyrophilin-like protein 8 n=1 Tax=Castor canadensis TaxID=51338 RepID=A0AC58LC79_CASCN
MSLIFRYTHDPHALLVLSLLNLVSGQWQVTVPEERIHILVGETATFSCFLSPETNAEGMEVRFFKNQFDDVVHLYRDKKDQENMRMPEYRRRTELVKDSLDRGHATLKLQKVTLSDAGLYGCWFRSQTHVQEATWELQVTELGSPPLISIMGHVDGGIQLLCHTSGWFPQPTIKWKTPQGTYLSSDSKVKKNMHGLFDVETSLTVQDNSGNVSCSVQPPDQSQEVESRVWVRDSPPNSRGRYRKN